MHQNPNSKHIIVDGGSIDNPLEILRKYEDIPSIRWISEPDKGQIIVVGVKK